MRQHSVNKAKEKKPSENAWRVHTFRWVTAKIPIKKLICLFVLLAKNSSTHLNHKSQSNVENKERYNAVILLKQARRLSR
jgi:uncharacterized protein YpmS